MKGKYLILEKLSGERYRPDMPLGDKSVQGFCLNEIELGRQFFLFSSKDDIKIGEAVIPAQDLPCAWTSQVHSFNPETMILKTANSTYKIEIKENE